MCQNRAYHSVNAVLVFAARIVFTTIRLLKFVASARMCLDWSVRLKQTSFQCSLHLRHLKGPHRKCFAKGVTRKSLNPLALTARQNYATNAPS